MYVLVAVRNLVQARRRTALLSAALGLVTMLLVLMQSLSQGLDDTLIRVATTLSSGHVNIAGFFKDTPTSAAPIVTKAAEIRKIVEENTPGLDFVIDRARGWSKVLSDTGSIQAGLIGVDLAEERRLVALLELVPEKDYKEGGRDEVLGSLDLVRERGRVILFAKQAKRLDVTVGDEVTVSMQTMRGSRNSDRLVVAGVARDLGLMSSWSVFVDKAFVYDLYQLRPDTSGAVMVYLKDPSKSDETMNHLRGVFEDKGYRLMDHVPQAFWMKFETVSGEDWVGQKLDLNVWKDSVSWVTWIITAIDSLSFTLLSVLVVIIVIGIMNTMWIAVRERTSEIGTLRAIGMSRRRVLTMFMTEALLLGLCATTVGALVGAAIAAGVNAAEIRVPVEAMQVILLSDQVHLSVRLSHVLTAIGAFTLVTALAALWPAIRASRLQPVTAIHHIE